MWSGEASQRAAADQSKGSEATLHRFFEPGDWFAPKKHGYGAGLPIAWQGWALIIAYAAVVVGAGLLIDPASAATVAAPLALMAAATLVFVIIARRRTRGGWQRRG